MTKPWRQRYIAHLASPYWAELKRKVTARRGNKCERCGKSGCGLDLHHKHYRTLGRERQKDVMLLCRADCHRQADKQRATEGRIRSAEVRVNLGIESTKDIELLTATKWRATDGTHTAS
jgi:hypothetical protein